MGCFDGMPYSLVRMCLSQVTLLPTALTKLTGTNCLVVSPGNAGHMSFPLVGGTRALKKMCALPGGGGGGGDGHGRSSRLWIDGLEERAGETGLSQPCCETLLPRQTQEIFLIFSSVDLATMSSYLEFQKFSRSRLPVYSIPFFGLLDACAFCPLHIRQGALQGASPLAVRLFRIFYDDFIISGHAASPFLARVSKRP